MEKKKACMRNQHTHSYQHTSPHPVCLDYTYLGGKLLIITNYGTIVLAVQLHHIKDCINIVKKDGP